MRKILLFLWLLIPVAAAAYHFGPGQDHRRLEDARDAIERAEAAAALARIAAAGEGSAVARGHWRDADAAYEEALQLLPKDRVHEMRRLRLERSKAQMFLGELPSVRQDLEGLIDEIAAEEHQDERLLEDARNALANAQYYMTWLLRLEGAPRPVWEPEIEASRQLYRLIAEQAEDDGRGAVAQEARENLEASIRLARMELTELQGLPLPSQ